MRGNDQRKKSVCFITGQLGLGGAERQLYLLVKGLSNNGWRVSVISLNPDQNDFWENPLLKLGIRIYKIPRSSNPLLRLPHIYKAVQKERPYILQSWTIYANFYASLSGFVARVPHTFGAERSDPEQSRQRIGHFWYKLSLMGIDGCLVNSKNAYSKLQEMCPNLNIFYIKNGIEVRSHNNNSFEPLRNDFNIPKTKIVIGTIGSLYPYKNISLLINAFSKILLQHDEAYLVIVGDGLLLPNLKEEASAILCQGTYQFLGKIEDGYKIMNMFDIFCLPSTCEGMPNVVMEASAAGIPVVATKVGAVPELIDDQQSGMIVQPDNEKGLIEAILILATNEQLRSRMGKNGREKMISEFSVQSMVDAVDKIYREFYEL